MVEIELMYIYSKGLDKLFWAEAICCANHILNIVHAKVFLQVTPKEKWNGRKLDISNFKIFGNECWTHILDEKWKILEPKSHICIFIGYGEDSTSYMLFDPSTQGVFNR